MKRVAAIIIAAAIVMSMSLTAFAADGYYYTINDATYTKGSGATVTITCNGPYDLFDYLTIDGKTIEATISEGSTVAVISNDVLESLSVGKHTVQFFYKDGKASNQGTLTILAKDSAKSPKTGQDVSLYLAFIIAAAAGCGIVATRRKRA